MKRERWLFFKFIWFYSFALNSLKIFLSRIIPFFPSGWQGVLIRLVIDRTLRWF